MTRKNAAKNEARQRQAKTGGSYQQHKTATTIARRNAWMCTRCKKPIAFGEGYVALRDPDDKGHPGDPPLPPPPKEGEKNTDVLVRSLFVKNHVEYVALHYDCQTSEEEEHNPYWIAVERAETPEDWMAWVHHLGEKRWMTKRDLRIMLSYWFSNRGDDLHRHGG